MNKERLQRLAVLLDTVNPKLFDILSWAQHIGDDGTNFHDSDSPNCRTAACAVGWATSDPWFREQGLVLRRIYSHWTPSFGDGLTAAEAVKCFFDIKDIDLSLLFLSHTYEAGLETTPAMVAERIRKFTSGQKI